MTITIRKQSMGKTKTTDKIKQEGWMRWGREREKEKGQAKEKEERKDLVGHVGNWDTSSGSAQKAKEKEGRNSKDQEEVLNLAAAGSAAGLTTNRNTPREKGKE